MAYTTPQREVDRTISTAPIAPFVALPRILPNPIAGARQAKNRKSVVAKLCALRPSVMSDFRCGNRREKSRPTPTPKPSNIVSSALLDLLLVSLVAIVDEKVVRVLRVTIREDNNPTRGARTNPPALVASAM